MRPSPVFVGVGGAKTALIWQMHAAIRLDVGVVWAKDEQIVRNGLLFPFLFDAF